MRIGGENVMTASVLDDPRRALETRVAYLRLGLREGGIAIDVKGGHALTDQLRELVTRGDMALMRPDRSTRRMTMRVHTTPQGVDRLADYDVRYGETFGPASTIPTLKADATRRRRDGGHGGRR